MHAFVQRHAAKVMGSLSGFDRLWFRGTLRLISHAAGLGVYLRYAQGGATLLKDFTAWSQELTQRVRECGRATMRAAGREVVYVNSSSSSKEAVARALAARQGITSGLVCLLEVVEPCQTFEVHRNRGEQRLELRSKAGKCLQQYAYLIDERVGWCHVRVQTWLPLEVRVGMNGREWLCRDLTRAGIAHVRKDNCVTWLAGGEAVVRAQELLDQQVRTNWGALLEDLLGRVNPVLPALLRIDGEALQRYWSLEQSEWATDILFKEAAELGRLYPYLLRQGMLGLGSADVMRFLGAPVSVHGVIPKNFQREVVSDIKTRHEGTRIKHRVGSNSVKMYDKQGSVLRTETTIHDPRSLRVYRGTEQDPEAQKWRACRKGVADVHRVAEVGQRSNERYLSLMAQVEGTASMGEVIEPLCRGVRRQGRSYRGLRPLGAEDGALLAGVGRGEWGVNGFSNGQLRGVLYGEKAGDKAEERRRSGKVGRQLALLRAHGLVRRISRTRRWMLTAKGREVVTLVAAAKHASAKELMQKAA